MRIGSSFTLLLLGLLLLIGCSNTLAEHQPLNAVREAAWNSLSSDERRLTLADWQKAEVEKINFDDMINQFSIPKGVEPQSKKHLYKVTFDPKLIIYVNGDTNEVVGTLNLI